MRTTTLIGVGLLFVVAPALAQERPKAEIGTGLGLTVLAPDGGDAIVLFGIPGAGTASIPALVAPVLYVTFFTSPQVMVEPQFHVSVINSGGETAYSTAVMGQVGYLFAPERTGSAYLAGHGGVAALDLGGFSSTEVSGAAGFALGYRVALRSGPAVRVEARYRRWFGDAFDQLNDIALVFGIGAVIR